MKTKLKKIIKKTLLSFAYYSGAFDLCRIYYNQKGFVPILVYHRIVNDKNEAIVDSSFFLKGLCVSKSRFEKQIKHLNRKYKIVSLTEYIRRKKLKQDLSGFAVITFDDGFKDLLDNGWHILKKYQAPAAVFVFNSALERVYWKHKVYLILDNAKLNYAVIKSEYGGEIVINLKSNEKKYQTIQNLIGILEYKPGNEREKIINQLIEELGVTGESRAREIYLNLTDLKEINNDGAVLGAHSVNHDCLTELNKEQLSKELVASFNFIKDITKQDEIPFSLPFGCGSEEIIKELKRYGFLCNFINAPVLNSRDEDIFKLRRIAVLDFDMPEFVYNISGAEMFLNRLLKLFRAGYYE